MRGVVCLQFFLALTGTQVVLHWSYPSGTWHSDMVLRLRACCDDVGSPIASGKACVEANSNEHAKGDV